MHSRAQIRLNNTHDVTDFVQIINKDGSITVEDEGRGVPVGMHSSGMSTPEVIYTVLHAGGKFESGGYKVSGGCVL